MLTYQEEYEEEIDLTVEPWKTMAANCWNSPSAYRMGAEAERRGVAECPYRKEKPRELYEAGRKMMRAYLLQNTERSGAERPAGAAS